MLNSSARPTGGSVGRIWPPTDRVLAARPPPPPPSGQSTSREVRYAKEDAPAEFIAWPALRCEQNEAADLGRRAARAENKQTKTSRWKRRKRKRAPPASGQSQLTSSARLLFLPGGHAAASGPSKHRRRRRPRRGGKTSARRRNKATERQLSRARGHKSPSIIRSRCPLWEIALPVSSRPPLRLFELR